MYSINLPFASALLFARQIEANWLLPVIRLVTFGPLIRFYKVFDNPTASIKNVHNEKLRFIWHAKNDNLMLLNQFWGI